MKFFTKNFFKKVSYIVVIVMIFSIISVINFTPAAAIGENLLANLDPGFESSTWTNMLMTSDDKHSGVSCGEVDGTVADGTPGPAGTPKPLNIRKFNNQTELKADTQYELSCYIKTITSNKYFFNFQLVWNSGGKNISAAKYLLEQEMPTFTKVSYLFSTPKDLLQKIDGWNYYIIDINTYTHFYIDDISIVEVGPAPLETPTPIPTAGNTYANSYSDC